MKFAVIGAGITGMSAAWLLGTKHDVTLYEAEHRLGGHSNTIDVAAPEGRCPVDTGFIVYNTACYPNLIALFDRLGVPTAPTDMGFAVSFDGGAYEYSGSTVASLFGQWSNIVSPVHWRMVFDILRFFREAGASDVAALDPNLTLSDWLNERGYGQRFIDRHIIPMGAAIWSTPANEMLQFPFAAFARFFANHGLLKTHDRPPWRTVKGGSREYVARLASELKGPIIAGDPVVALKKTSDGVIVRTMSGSEAEFDAALLACHADTAAAVAGDADPEAKRELSVFRYAQNLAILHSDERQMPRRRGVWAAWNYVAGDAGGQADGPGLSLTYWMNRLQPLPTATNYFVTLNPTAEIPTESIIAEVKYQHPMFNAAALSAQTKLWSLQGRNGIWYAGSYFAYGFHEDGIQSGLATAEHMSEQMAGEEGRVVRPWTWDAAQSRIRGFESRSEGKLLSTAI